MHWPCGQRGARRLAEAGPLPAGAAPGWPRRAHRRLRHSLKARLVLSFLLLALGITASFLFGMQSALTAGWRDAARPLLADYVDRLAAEIGTPPSVERAQALVQRLPVTVAIDGPAVRWRSHPTSTHGEGWPEREGSLLSRTTASCASIT